MAEKLPNVIRSQYCITIHHQKIIFYPSFLCIILNADKKKVLETIYGAYFNNTLIYSEGPVKIKHYT